jgi:hypothetical protein
MKKFNTEMSPFRQSLRFGFNDFTAGANFWKSEESGLEGRVKEAQLQHLSPRQAHTLPCWL